MALIERLAQRFIDLEAQLGAIAWRRDEHLHYRYSSGEEWRSWASSAMHLIALTFGEGSVHFANFKGAYDKCTGREYEIADLVGVFRAAAADYRGGYSTSVEATISGEVLGDFLGMAKISLADGHKDVAAVLACAALEDSLKRFARLNGLDVDDKVMQEVVSALKAKRLVSGAQKSLLEVMPKIRDASMHANWDRIQDTDVASVIGMVEQLLLSKFA
ncbi:MAG: DUF4145 domain-containing protein [Candidatus Binatia bacterium]